MLRHTPARGLAPLLVLGIGQSNMNGQDALGRAWPLDTRGYFADAGNVPPSAPIPIAPYLRLLPQKRNGATATHGVELPLVTSLANATGRRIYYALASVNSTAIDTYLPSGGANWPLVQSAVLALLQAPATDKPIQIISYHGESDSGNNTSQQNYEDRYLAVLAGIEAMIGSLSWRMHMLRLNMHNSSGPGFAAVRAAATNLPNRDNRIFMNDSDAGNPALGGSVHWSSDQFFDFLAPITHNSIITNGGL